MIGNLRAASDADIARLLANPVEITRYLYGGGEAGGAERVSLNKAWHAIHFVLTGSRLGGDEPLNFLASEGTPVGDVDVGYGPARVLNSQQVKAIAARLAELSPERVEARVDLSTLDEHQIYPGNWQRDGLSVEYVVTNYQRMRELIVQSAERGDGLVLYIN
jgi:hypothetical protein